MHFLADKVPKLLKELDNFTFKIVSKLGQESGACRTDISTSSAWSSFNNTSSLLLNVGDDLIMKPWDNEEVQ